MSLVVTKKIKNLFKEKGLKTSQEAVDALDKELRKVCLKAADEAIAGKRKTVKGAHVPNVDGALSSDTF